MFLLDVCCPCVDCFLATLVSPTDGGAGLPVAIALKFPCNSAPAHFELPDKKLVAEIGSARKKAVNLVSFHAILSSILLYMEMLAGKFGLTLPQWTSRLS